MQRGLRVITLQGAIEKSPILLSQYYKNEWLDGDIIISYFGGSKNIFADCIAKIVYQKSLIFLKFSFLFHTSNGLTILVLWSRLSNLEEHKGWPYPGLHSYDIFIDRSPLYSYCPMISL